jgi:hypothetical protein
VELEQNIPVYFRIVFYICQIFADPLPANANGSLAVCYASAQNRIRIHGSEFLYPAHCIEPKVHRSPVNRDFLHIYVKNPQVQ